MGTPAAIDQDVGAAGPRVEGLGLGDGSLGVVGQGRRHFDRGESVPASAGLVLGVEELRGLRDVVQGEVEEGLLGRTLRVEPADGRIVSIRPRDRPFEDGRIRGQSGDRQLARVAANRSLLEQIAADAVEPDALAVLPKRLESAHGRNLAWLE
jgi:hypothetical protein